MKDNEAPGKALRSLISAKEALLILGVQRSGTTLLGEDISSLRVLGCPQESFLLAEAVSGPKEAQYRKLAELGASDRGECFGLTLMVNYLAKFGKWISPDESRADIKTLEDIAIRFFRDRFDKLTVLTLRREPLWHVAYSHWRVSVTNQYHRYSDGVRTGSRSVDHADGDPVVPDPEGIILMLAQVIEKYRRIDDILARNGITPIRLTYEEVSGSFPDYLRRVMVAAGRPETDTEKAKRVLVKLTPEDEISAASEALKAVFQN